MEITELYEVEANALCENTDQLIRQLREREALQLPSSREVGLYFQTAEGTNRIKFRSLLLEERDEIPGIEVLYSFKKQVVPYISYEQNMLIPCPIDSHIHLALCGASFITARTDRKYEVDNCTLYIATMQGYDPYWIEIERNYSTGSFSREDAVDEVLKIMDELSLEPLRPEQVKEQVRIYQESTDYKISQDDILSFLRKGTTIINKTHISNN